MRLLITEAMRKKDKAKKTWEISPYRAIRMNSNLNVLHKALQREGLCFLVSLYQ